MSKTIKNLVDSALYKDGNKIDILLMGDNKRALDISSKSRHTIYSFDKIQNCFLLDQYSFFNNLSYNIDLIICTDPYKKISYIKNLSSRLKLPVLFVHDKAPEIKKELIFQLSFELDEYYNVVGSHEIYNKLGIIGAEIVDLETIEWDDYINVLLLKNR